MIRKAIVGVVAVAAALSLSACSKAMEPFQDAPTGSRDLSPANLISFPDGFSNVATKCDHGNRLYVAFHSDSPYAAIAVSAGDPSCRP